MIFSKQKKGKKIAKVPDDGLEGVFDLAAGALLELLEDVDAALDERGDCRRELVRLGLRLEREHTRKARR